MKVTKDKVTHLSFEGGGGKGVVYLGALKALEKLGVLDEPVGKREQSPIKGVSGSSAGAITAYMVALGFKSTEIAAVLADKPRFEALYESPQIGKVRRVHDNEYTVSEPLIFAQGGCKSKPIPADQYNRVRKDIEDFPGILGALAGFFPAYAIGSELERYGGIKELLGKDAEGPARYALGALGTFALPALVRWYLRLKLNGMADDNPAIKPLIDKLTASDSQFQSYLASAVLDRGLFPGFELRDLLLMQMITFLKKTGHAGKRTGDDLTKFAAKVSFDQLRDWTGIDLVVTGVNVTYGTPGIFRATPQNKKKGEESNGHFSVVDAVSISASFPFAFKPVIVTDTKGVKPGLWMDGGVLNNQPLHAFDGGADKKLNSGMLSLRLEEPSNDPDGGLYDPRKPPGMSAFLGAGIGQLVGTMMYPSEPGKLRTKEEGDQAISLDTGVLSTLEFSPPVKLAEFYINRAYRTTRAYFGIGTAPRFPKPCEQGDKPNRQDGRQSKGDPQQRRTDKQMRKLRKEKADTTLVEVVKRLGTQ